MFPLQVLILLQLIHRAPLYDQVTFTVHGPRTTFGLGCADLVADKVVTDNKVTLGDVEAFLSDVSSY